MTEFKAGQITKTQFESNILDRTVTLSVYLPEDYSNDEPSNVIFCFDGRDFMRYGQIHRLYERLWRKGEIKKSIIIGFHYESVHKRHEEFHPQGEFASMTVRAVATEIFPWIDETFTTHTSSESRVLLGDSLAGSIAFLTALSYPRTLSQVGMLSPHVDEVVELLLNRCQFKGNLSIWHVIGKEEIDFKLPTSGERADFLTPNRELKKLLEPTVRSYYYDELDGGHNWKTWQKELPKLLKYFLSNE
ncbi:esterase family protein [Staphylococcus canis]|uniref:Esterase family protein n=1 Tax=Staphylococcus canis TaxID=2724942 RepID=A0ABS0T9M6_9STAP|nr:alpha/beta hydrolase-fold protein [Staphylococcus canis]MBI5975260.1 esterase family protein [Staphylococcus canis]